MVLLVIVLTDWNPQIEVLVGGNKESAAQKIVLLMGSALIPKDP